MCEGARGCGRVQENAGRCGRNDVEVCRKSGRSVKLAGGFSESLGLLKVTEGH